MAGIFKKLLLILIIALSFPLLVFFIPRQDPDSYLNANIDKLDRLQKEAPPRLVLIGGSNLAFGVDSQALTDSLGVPAVNLGLHAGLGLRFMLREAAPFLRPGDTVVIIPEYELYAKGSENGTLIALLELQKARITAVDWNQFKTISRLFPEYIRSKLIGLARSTLGLASREQPDESTTYSRRGFNDRGDEIRHLSVINSEWKPSLSELTAIKLSTIDDSILRLLSEFQRKCTRKSINVCISFPPMPTESCQTNEKVAEDLVVSLRKDGLNVISKPSDYLLDTTMFYDTLYHLNAIGRAERTLQLIKDLKNSGIQLK